MQIEFEHPVKERKCENWKNDNFLGQFTQWGLAQSVHLFEY